MISLFSRILLGLSLIFSMPFSVQAQESNAKTMAQVQAHLRGLKSLSAQFVQTAPNGKASRGVLKLARPGGVRFEYTDGTPLLVVANRRRLSFIDYEVAQVSSWPIAETPLRVLLDTAAPLERIAQIVPPAQSGLPGFVTVRAADPKNPNYGVVTLFFAPSEQGPAGLMLAAWRVQDAQGGLTTVQLSGQTANGPIPQNSFTFRDPRLSSKGPRGKGG